MKKIIVLLCVIFIGLSASAVNVVFESTSIDENRFEKQIRKASAMAAKIRYANNLKHAPVLIYPSNKMPNAHASIFDRDITIYTGILPYLESDDELAYVVSHELAHTMETSRFVPVKVVTMSLCPVRYEYKADLTGIDYMVKAGYDPIAAIFVNNKLAAEHWWEWINAHPRGSKRMLAMYKYIYIKYPQYLNSPMTNDIVYKDFLRAQSKEIEKFQQQYKQRKREAI